MNLPEVALLIPAYNSAKTLPNLLEDAHRQTHPFAEIIVYDDGSNDATSEIASQYHCKVIRSDVNRGAGYARQKLLEAATKNYIHFHDADDRMNPNFLEILLPYCVNGVAVCCTLKEVQKDGEVLLRKYSDLNSEVDKISFFIRNFVHMNTMIYPREEVLAKGRFDTELRTNQDRVFHYRLAASDIKFIFVDKPLVTQIRNPESTLSNTKFSKIIANFIRGAEIALDIFPEKYHGLLTEYLMFYAEKAAYKGAYDLVKQAVALAKNSGQVSLEAYGFLSRILSQLIGIEKMLILRGYYAKFRRSITSV
jgi:glycosyltransferase involved in cell wall biosynthesis